MGDATRVIKKLRIIEKGNETLNEKWITYSELKELPKGTVSIYNYYYEPSYENFKVTFEQLLSLDDGELLGKAKYLKTVINFFTNERYLFKHLFCEMQLVMVKLFNIESFPVEKIITFLIDLNFMTEEGDYLIFRMGETADFIKKNCDKLKSLNVLHPISTNTRF